ncbi:uncharacterized protein LOC130769223 isoform X3 [Actinidia eriantha]|uniref:uncharacterized protein LOC130769223 isoform X3 n=1 Tax=Actinidia eriantha TaxID=165200 RepID=UPI0025862389|nr:uncharacterized protein LOC130769223 isoform X3 [Actinidia eriantha]
MATETDVPDLIPLTKRELEYKELKSELPDVTANEVPQEEKKVESLLIQLPEASKVLDKAEDTAAANFLQVADVNVVNKGDVEAIDGEFFLESPSIADGKSKTNTEKNQLNTNEELCGMHDEEGGMIIDKHLIVKADSVENARVIIQTADLAEGSSMEVENLGEVCNIEEKMGYISSTETTSIEQDLRETSNKEEKKPKIFSSSVGTETDSETIQPNEDIEDNKDKGEEISSSLLATDMNPETKQPSEDREDNKDKGEEMLCADVKDVCMPKETAGPDNHKTEDATESSEAAKDKLDESSSAFKEGSIETTESSEKMKYVMSMEDETQNKDSEPSLAEEVEDKCFQKVENLETFKEESDDELKDIMKESHNGEQNQDVIPKAIDTADSSSSSTDKVGEITEPEAEVSSREPEESMKRESMDLAQIETLTMECKNEGVMAVTGKDDTMAEDQDQIETPQHKEYSEQGSIQTTEQLKVNFESALDVASDEIGKKIHVGSRGEFLGETRNIYTKISEDINMKEIPEQKNLSAVDLDEKNGSAEVEIPNKNGNDLYVTHPPVEVTVQVGDEKHDGVPIPKSGDQFHEAFEAHKEEEMHINDTYEAGKSPESTILEHTFNVCTPGPDNHKTDEATESDEAAEDNLDEISSTKVVPGAGENLENSSMTFEEGSQETIESSENMKDLTSEDEIQNKNSESSLVQKVEDICFQKVEILETFNEEPETELKDIVKGNQNGEHNQNEILKTIATADSSQSIIGKVDDNSEPKANVLSRDFEESTVRESKNLAQTEALTMECKHEGLTAVADEDNTLAEEHDQIETTKHEEHLESSMQKTEPTEENSESTLDVASEEIREQIPVGSPEEVLGETRTVETEISDDINKETPEEKNLSILDLDEKNRSAEVEIPSKNENNLCVTHPNPVEETIHEGGVKHSEVSISELEDQGHEAPKEEEEHVHETFEASKSPESTIVENISTGVPLNIDDLEKRGELNTEEESMEITTVDNIKEEIEQKEKAADEEFHRATTCDDNKKHTFEEEIPVTNSTPLCTGEEPDHYDQEDKSRPNNFDEATPESDGRDQSCKTSNESLNIKEPITEEQAIQEYETKIADKGDEVEKEMKIEEDITTEHSLESAREDTKKCFEDNDTEMGKELETSSKGEDIEKQVLAEESKVQERSIVFAGELEAEDSKEDAMSTKMPKQEVIEVLQTVFGSTNVGMQPKDEDGTEKDNFAVFNREETKNECSYEEEKVEKEPDTEVLETNYRGQDTAEHIIKNCVSIQSAESFEEKTVQQSSHEDEANEHYDNAETSMIISESTITYFPSSSVGDKIVEETLKEDRRDTLRSEEEVSNANTECIVQTFDAPHSIEEREARTLKSEAKPNEGLKDEYIIGSTEQEITPKESNLHIENSSGPETSKREICEAILKKEDSKVTVVAAETSLTEAVSEYTMQVDSSDPVFGEMGLVTEGGTSNIPNPVEGLELGENKGMEIPTTRTHITDEVAGTYTEGKNKAHDTLAGTEDLSEIARAEISLDASEQIIHESSALSMEEHKVVFVEVSDITGEIPEKDSGSCGHVDIPSVAEITKHNIMEMEDETTNPKKMGSTNIEKESANDDAQDEDQEMHTPSELTNEKHINESDVELLNRVSISKVDNCSEIANLETIEDENSSDIGLQKDKSTVNEASKGAEACDRGDDSEKHTFEEDMPVTNSTPLCTEVEADNVDQDDKSAPNSYEEAAPESDSRNQSCRTSNETLNVKKPITEEQEIEEYEDLKIADREKDIKKEEHIITDHSLESAREDITKCFEENKTEAKCKAEMEKELETTNEGEDIEQRVLAEESRVQERTIMSVGELEALKVENSKEDAMITKMPKQEIKEEDGTAKDNFVACAGEETKNDCSYEEEKVEKEPDTEVHKTNYRGHETTEHVVKNCTNIQSADFFDEKTVQESSQEDKGYENAKTSMIIKESAITDFPSLSVGDKIVEESLKENRREALGLEEEVFDATHFTWEKEVRALKSEAEPNEIGSTEEEISSKASNLDLLENFSSVLVKSNQEIGEEILEEANSKVTVIAKETSLTEAESKYIMQAQERGLVTERSINKIPKLAEGSHLGEKLGMEIPTARTDEATNTEGRNKAHVTLVGTEDLSEIARAETSLDALELNMHESSALSLEEYKVVIVEVSEKTGEAPEKDSGSCGKEDIPPVVEIAKDNIMKMEDETTNPKKMGSTNIEKEGENDDAQDEDQEMHTPSELIDEKHINESDVKLLNRVSTGEADNCNEIAKLETIEDENSSNIGLQKDNSGNETAVNEASKVAKACDRSIDTEKPIVEQEDSATSFEGSSKEGVEIGKAIVEFEAEGHSYGSEASEATSINSLKGKNIKSVDTGEELRSAPESVAEDESNIAFPETIRTNCEEESNDDGNQTADSIKDQISGQDIQEGKQTTNEEMEPRLETQKETKETQDTILTEKMPREIQRADESEINKEQTMEGESCTKKLHMMAAGDETVHEVTDLDVTPTQSLEVTDSDNLTEMVKPKVAEDFNQEFESSPMRKALEEEIQRAVEKPVDDSSSVSEVSEEKINKENTEDTDRCDTSQQDSEVDSMKLEVLSTMVSQLPIHEDENADYERITVEKSDAHAAEVEETKILDAGSESTGIEEIHETGTSLTIGDIDTNEIEKQITEVPGALPVPIDQGAEAATDDEILAPTVVTEVIRSREFHLNDEPVEALDNSSEAQSLETGKTADSRQQEAEVDNVKLEEAPSMTSHLPTHEHQTADILSMNIEKSDAIDNEETKIPDATSESKTQGATEIHKTETSLTVGETNTNEIEEKIRDTAEALPEPVNQGDEAASNNDIAPGGIVQAEKTEGPLQVSSYALLSNEDDGETTTAIGKAEDACTKKDDPEFDNLKLEETSGMVSKLLGTECESANNVTMEKLDANEVKVEEKETLDVVSEPKDIDFEEVSSSMKVEEASSMTSHLPTHEHQTTNIRSMNIEKSYATDVEVEETKMPDSASESKVQGSREIYETVTSLTVGEIDRSQIEGQIREASETVNQGVEVASNDEIAPECESAIEVTVENSDAAEENKTWDAVYEPKDQDFGEFPSSMRLVEASSMMSHLPIHERQKADILSLNAEKSDAIDNEVEETKTPDAASQSKTQGDTEIHETETSLTAIETDTIEMDKKTRDDTKALSEPINQGGEAASNDEIAPGGIVQAEKIEGPPQVSFSDLLSNEEDGETTTTIGNTEDACTKEDDTDVDNLKLEETSGMDSHRLIAECESSKVTVEKTDANAVKFEENEILDAVSKPGDQDFEEIHETWAIPTAEITDTDKIEEEIKVIENVSYQDVEVVADGQTPAQPLPVGKSEGELPVLSSPLFSSEQDFESRTTIKKKEDKNSINVETEVDMIELEATGMLPKVPTTEHEDVDNVSATIEKSDAEEVDEAKDSEDISESKVHGVAEIQEIGRPTEGKTRTEEAEEERKAVPEAIFEPNYQGVEAIIHGDTTPNQTLPVDREEQLQEPSSAVLNEQDYKTITEVEMRADESTKKAEAQLHQTVADFFEIGATEKPCLQNEGPRELEVSDFDSTAQEDPQNRAPEEESTALEEASTVKPREYIPERNNADFATEYEKTPVHCSSQDTSKDEDIMDSGNSNKDSGDIPIHPEIKKLLPGGVGERCEEASNLESEKTGKVLESVSEIQCLEVNPILEGTKIKNGHLEGAITELRDGQNRSEETIEADESIKKDTSEEKVTGENQVVRNSLTMSPHEETVTNSNQEDELLAEYYRGERTNEELFEESEKAGAGKNIKKTITAEDRSAEDPYQVLVGDETANISPSEEVNDGKKVEKAPVKVDPESRGDKINFRGTAIEATAPIEEVSFEVLLAKHENITGDSSEETVMSKDEKQKNTDVAVPSIKDAVDKEAPDYKFSEKFDEGSTPAPTVPTHETIETCGEDKEIASANSKNSETLMDNEKLNHQSHEISCEGNCNTDGWNLKDKELYVDKPSISCSVATSQAEITNKENENTADEKQDFTSDKQTTEAARLLEKEKGIQFSEELTKVEELVELSTIGNESKRNEANIHSTTDDNEDEKTQNLNEIPNLLSDAKDTGVSHEGDTMDFADVNEITKDTKELEKTSLSIAHEQIARDADPSDSTETINSTATTGVTLVQKCPFEKAFQNAENKSGYAAGSEPEAKAVEYREEEKLGEECQETTEKAIPIDSAKMSLSDLLQRSIKRNLQGVEHLTEEKGVTEKLQTETAETAQVEEAKTDEEEEGGEHKNEDSGSDAQVLVEASTDVKVPHKKSHHIFSGVGSKVKHSIAKVKKVITGKSSHPKTTTPK